MTTTPALWRPAFTDNVNLPGNQFAGVVAPTADNQFFAVWIDAANFNPGLDTIVARKFDSSGPVAANPDVPISLFPGAASDRNEPVAVRLPIPGADDGLAVAYRGDTGGQGDIFLVRTDAALVKGPEINIEVSGTDADVPSITSFSDGSLVVAYTFHNGANSNEIDAKRIDATGVVGPVQTLFAPGTSANGADLATLTNGTVVAVFENGAANNDVFFTIKALGTGLALTNVVSPAPVANTADFETMPHVAALADGGFAVTWSDFTTQQIRASVYDANGNVVHGNILVNFFDPTTVIGQSDVTALPDGGFLVAWSDIGATPADRAERFDETGNYDGTSIVWKNGPLFSPVVDAATYSDGRAILTTTVFGTGMDVSSSIWDTRVSDANQVTGDNFIGPGGGTSDMLIIANHNGIRTADALQFENGNLQSSTVIAITGSNVSFDGAGDFNHDGLSDLLAHTDNLSNGVRTLFAYQMTPVGPGGTSTVANLGQDWITDAFGDFNGDGTSDILLHRDAGGTRTFEALSINNYAVQSTPIVQVTGVDWNVDGTGDFNHDGTSDILEHRIVGGTMNVQVVTLNNIVVQSVSPIANLGADWQIDGTGDFNQDGTSDILMHQDLGRVRTLEVVTINNGINVGGTVVAQVGTNFVVDGIGDFNHDGTSDIAMHVDTGTTRNDWVFTVANNVLQNAHIVASTGIDWHVS
jgi:hypothetical protein